MIAHRICSLTAFAVVLLIVSCAAPAAPTSAPTQPAPPVAAPTQVVAPTSAPTQPAPSVASPTQAPTSAPTPTTAPTAVPTKAMTPTYTPTQPAAPIPVPTKAATQSSGQMKLNMDEIFPPGPGRELVLDNCTTCHTFVPIVVLQMDKNQWERDARDHRDRVPRLTDAEFRSLYDYLIANFNPNRPVPKLPKELLDTWTDY